MKVLLMIGLVGLLFYLGVGYGTNFSNNPEAQSLARSMAGEIGYVWVRTARYWFPVFIAFLAVKIIASKVKGG